MTSPRQFLARTAAALARGLSGATAQRRTAFDRAKARWKLVDHIETVVSRYRGDIPSWDVVNESPMDPVPTYFKRRNGKSNRLLPLDAEFKPKPLFDVTEAHRRKVFSSAGRAPSWIVR